MWCILEIVPRTMEKQDELGQKFDSSSAKNDGSSSVISECEEDSNIHPFVTNQEKLQRILHSHKFQVFIITLVVVDCLLVITELILDVRLLEHHEEGRKIDETAPHVLHYMSIAILSIFIIEISVKVYAFRLEFFRHKLEVFDAFVVFLSFSLDVAFRDEGSITNAFGLFIMLRLWRVVRILNGVVLSVKTQAEHKLHKERQMKEGIEQELMKCRDYANALEMEVELLRGLLKQHGIKEIPSSVVNNSEKSNVISVVAEVNHMQPV